MQPSTDPRSIDFLILLLLIIGTSQTDKSNLAESERVCNNRGDMYVDRSVDPSILELAMNLRRRSRTKSSNADTNTNQEEKTKMEGT